MLSRKSRPVSLFVSQNAIVSSSAKNTLSQVFL